MTKYVLMALTPIFYIAMGAFIAWDLNISEWNFEDRALIVITTIGTWAAILAFPESDY